jgi:hypothetical protein
MFFVGAVPSFEQIICEQESVLEVLRCAGEGRKEVERRMEGKKRYNTFSLSTTEDKCWLRKPVKASDMLTASESSSSA